GVTYHDNPDLRKAQEEAFRKQVEFACELALPLIVHSRGAYSSLCSILKEEKADRVRGVVHNFEGDARATSELLDMGFLLSFGGAITYPDATGLHEIIRHVPRDSILIETDSPYMPLYLQSTDTNEPANVARVIQTAAEIRKVDIEEMISTVYDNFRNLLSLEG
ncbi:MAG: hydrolase TatD, partial [candidate division Zixibacteria bacterium]|nr:hydrolase TatD [candidate division Zixibacteria bacterium]